MGHIYSSLWEGRPVDKKPRVIKDAFARAHDLHWWDDHPPANPETEPLYAELLGHLDVAS